MIVFQSTVLPKTGSNGNDKWLKTKVAIMKVNDSE